MVNPIQHYRDQFMMIKECKDQRIKNKQLSVLMTEMENEFNIPAFKDEEFNKANQVEMALYTDISNARFN